MKIRFLLFCTLSTISYTMANTGACCGSQASIHDVDKSIIILNTEEIISDLQFIEDDEELELGFDVFDYLPPYFDPYKGMIVDISEIHFLEDEQPFELGFDPAPYLPKGFNPYLGQ